MTRPLVASDSVDVVVSNCVLNLVEPGATPQLFRESSGTLRGLLASIIILRTIGPLAWRKFFASPIPPSQK